VAGLEKCACAAQANPMPFWHPNLPDPRGITMKKDVPDKGEMGQRVSGPLGLFTTMPQASIPGRVGPGRRRKEDRGPEG